MSVARTRAVTHTLTLAAALIAPALFARTGPTWSTIPTGSLPVAPGNTPKDIAAKERVEGLFVVQPNAERRKQLLQNGVHQVSVLLDSEQAKEAERNGGHPSDDGGTGRCITATTSENRGPANEWPGFLAASASVTRTKVDGKERSRHNGGMALPWIVHVERLVVTTQDRAELRVSEAFVDAATGGARETGRSVMPLSRLGAGPAGMVVWGAREGSRLHVVVTAPTPSEKLLEVVPFVRSASRRLSSQSATGSRVAQSDCGHLRVFLDVVAGDGETVDIGGSLISLPDDFDPADDSMRGRVQPQTRPITLAVSVTQLSSDKEPVVSIAASIGKPGAANF